MNEAKLMHDDLLHALLPIIPRTVYQDVRRLNTLVWAVVGLCLRHTVRLDAWAEVAPGRAQYAASRVRRFSRWLHHPAIAPPGSGSLEQDGPLGSVAMEEEEQARLMYQHRRGKTIPSCAQNGRDAARAVFFQRSTWAVSPVSRAHSCMLLLRDHGSVCCPEGGEAVPVAIAVCNGLPQALTRLFAAITHGRGDRLPALSAQGNPASRKRWLF